MMKSNIRRTKWLFMIFTVAFLFSELTLSMNPPVHATVHPNKKISYGQEEDVVSIETMLKTGNTKLDCKLRVAWNTTYLLSLSDPVESLTPMDLTDDFITPIPTTSPTVNEASQMETENTTPKKKKKSKKVKKKKKKRGTVYSAPPGRFKSFMPYRKSSGRSIFCTTSPQYRLQQKAYTADNGIRKVKGRYCVAVGSRYATKIGTKLDIEMKSGKVIKCILADQKANADTDSTNSYHLCDNSVAEFIVDTRTLDSRAKRSGNIGSIGNKFAGPIARIRVYT